MSTPLYGLGASARQRLLLIVLLQSRVDESPPPTSSLPSQTVFSVEPRERNSSARRHEEKELFFLTRESVFVLRCSRAPVRILLSGTRKAIFADRPQITQGTEE